jgi:hypothetical protein
LQSRSLQSLDRLEPLQLTDERKAGKLKQRPTLGALGETLALLCVRLSKNRFTRPPLAVVLSPTTQNRQPAKHPALAVVYSFPTQTGTVISTEAAHAVCGPRTVEIRFSTTNVNRGILDKSTAQKPGPHRHP